jgi:hypothetical protein
MKVRITIWVFSVLSLVQCRETDKFYATVLRSDVFVQLYEEHKWDFLWCLDNSGSMSSRRAFIRDNLQRFVDLMNTRKAVDFQMAVVTTDYFAGQGNLVSSSSGKTVVLSTDPDPIGDFASIIDNIHGSKTDFWEQCLESSYQALYKHREKFSRASIPLNLIIVSDEEDWSCKDDCYGVEPEHNTNWKQWEIDRYVKYFRNVKKSENSDVHVFPIVGVNSTDCSVASVGSRYMKVADEVGGLGITGSICNSKFQESYEAIAKMIADRGIRFPLTSQSSGKDIHVFVDRVPVPYGDDGYIYEESTNSIVFTGRIPRKDALIEITYSQKRD